MAAVATVVVDAVASVVVQDTVVVGTAVHRIVAVDIEVDTAVGIADVDTEMA